MVVAQLSVYEEAQYGTSEFTVVVIIRVIFSARRNITVLLTKRPCYCSRE